MIVFPNCKLNLGLWVIERLPDGYHSIETVFYPLPLTDILEIIPSQDGKTELTTTGISIPGNPEDNICFKAWRTLEEAFHIGSVKIALHKRIPSGAGLGGGSSNGAFTIQLLNNLFHLNLDSEVQKQFAFRLGMDCPFFIENSASYATGKGEKLSLIDLQLKGLYIAVINPPIHVFTAEAYAGIEPQKRNILLSEIIQLPITQWKDQLVNDFEFSVFKKYPEIRQIKQYLYKKGAVYASMTGSGSSVFGLFKEQPEFRTDFKDCFLKIARL